MSNPNISTRRTTLNKLSAESPLQNSSFRSPKSPNFTQPSNSQNESQDGEFVVPKPTKKIKPNKSGENTKSLAAEDQLKTGWSIPNLADSAQLEELLKKQAPGFLENIQMAVPDENWQREALKQIENSSLQKLLQNNINGFNTEGTFSGPIGASYGSLKPDEIMQFLGKLNDDFKQKIDYFPSIKGQLSQGLPAIPDIPAELQNALDDFVYQQSSFAMNGSNGLEKFLDNQSQKSASVDSNKSHILPKATNELTQSRPNNTKSKSQIETEEISHQLDQNLMAINQLKPEQDSPIASEGTKPRRSVRKANNESQPNLAKSTPEKPASDETKNFPPKELLGKRSLPKNNEEEPTQNQSQNQGDNELRKKVTRKSKTSELQEQRSVEPSPKNANKKSKIPTALSDAANKNQIEEEKKSPKSAKNRKSPRSTKDKASSSSEGEDDSLEMPFTAFRKEKEAMEIEQQNSGIQRIVNLKIGKNHQIAPTAFVLNKQRPRREVKKMVWNPKWIEEKAFDDYFEQLRNIVEKSITNEEVACRTLIKFDTDVEKTLDNIKRNVAYYKNQMIPGQRVLRNRASFLS